MFGPGANRLLKFLEITAHSVASATRGGEQGKQGYLRVMSANASRRRPNGFHPLAFHKRHEPKWFIVRESYIVALDDPATVRPASLYNSPHAASMADETLLQTEIWDVFLFDQDFVLERPKRLYKQGMHLLSSNKQDGKPGDGMPDEGDDDEKRKRDVFKDKFLPDHASKSGKDPAGHAGAGNPLDPSTTDLAQTDPEKLQTTSSHMFYLKNSERRLRVLAKTERQLDQFDASIQKMCARSIWLGKNRFGSFAPIRLNASAQWFVDGRDYYWSLSRAIMLARERIYIHDWWLSPELYLRRPPHENSQWRLDKLLKRKAEEGVQVFVVVYKEVSNDFTPVDSNYTKSVLRGLHPNIHVQRSPSHTSAGTLFWSHHEKMCVIDETIGFMGGLDLCFGRWDTPGHTLTDDGLNPMLEEDWKKAEKSPDGAKWQIWPGKDYGNQRVLDFHSLNKPEEDMYDRKKVPRQPWHDIGLQLIGQPARDLCRHFVQRWNYLLRNKNHTTFMPFLTPAPDFTAKQLQDLRISGTCEAQICRSVGPWSMGVEHVEHSIQNAYIKAIQLSEHFVYIENQFFISSTEVEGTLIENKIGDALVSRIVRAHHEGTPWRAVVVIPLVPGYPYPIDAAEAGSVRLIMECQFKSICRGEQSIFARLRREGIDPDEYITFFGLRGWGKMPNGALTTESVYIHAKGMVVDDRVVIIGSANINERSQRGDRDSELACVIRDTDMVDSMMAGKPYKVGRFAHTMRIRLMREHLGIDVDELEMREAADQDEPAQNGKTPAMPDGEKWDPEHEQEGGEGVEAERGVGSHTLSGPFKNVALGLKQTVNADASKRKHRVGRVADQIKSEEANAKESLIAKVTPAKGPQDESIEDEAGIPTLADRIADGDKSSRGFASSVVPTIEEKIMTRAHDGKIANADGTKHGRSDKPEDAYSARRDRVRGTPDSPSLEDLPEGVSDTRQLPMDGESPVKSKRHGDIVPDPPQVTDGKILDDAPPADVENGRGEDAGDGVVAPGKLTERSRRRSRAKWASVPSSQLNASMDKKSKGNEAIANNNAVASALRRNLRERPSPYTIPLPAPPVDPYGLTDPVSDAFYKDVWLAVAVRNTQIFRKVFRCVPDDLVQTWKQYRDFQQWAERHSKVRPPPCP